MTKKELYKLASDLWEGCDGCNENDKMFWINGFMHGFTYSYTANEDLDLDTFINNQKDLDTEFGEIIRDNFNDLI